MHPGKLSRIAASTAVALVAIHSLLAIANLNMDGDALRGAWQVSMQKGISGVLIHRGAYTVLYAAQSFVIWIVTGAIGLVFDWWNCLSTVRLISIISIAGIAALLLAAVRAAGGGALPQSLGVAFPFLWHGFSMTAISCDDNLPADFLRLAFVLGFAWRLGCIPAPGRWGKFTAGSPVFLGAILGLAMSWHLQSSLLVPACILAAWLGGKGPAGPRIRDAAVVAAAGAAVYLAWILASFAAGLGSRLAPGGLLPAFFEHYESGSGFWFFSSGRSLLGQTRLVWEGFAGMATGFSSFRPGWIWIILVPAFAALAAAALTAFAALRRTRTLKVLGAFLAVQILHALFFNSDNPERWDMPVIILGLLGALAAANPAGKRAVPAVFGLLSLLLLTANVVGYSRFVSLGERYFLEAAAGKRNLQEPKLDCIGAHWGLCRAARRFSKFVEPAAGFAGIILPKEGDFYVQYNALNWFSSYLGLYEPGFSERRGAPTYAVGLFEYPAALKGIRLARREGFAWLVFAEGLEFREAAR